MTPLFWRIMYGRDGLGAVEDALQVDGNHQVEIGLGHLLDQLAFRHLDEEAVAQDARVVDQDVDPAKSCDNLVHPGLHGLAVGDVELVEGSVRAELLSAASPACWLTSQMTTCAPSSIKRSAVALPMPAAPPVMSATLP